MPVVAQGGTVSLDAWFKNSLGEPVNSTNVDLTITDIFGTLVLHVTMPAITNPDIGHFVYDYACPVGQAAGDYIGTWAGDFAGERLSGEDKIIVVPPGYIATGPLDFLVKPDDYAAVRGVLGVTELDVEDTDIELSSFGPQAEYLIKSRITWWAEQMDDPVALFPLRMAEVYKTAALMAESYVRGGTIGFVRPLSTGEGRNWAAAAIDFEAGYNYWIGVAEQSNPVPAENGGVWSWLHPIAIGGPTRRRHQSIAARYGWSPDVITDPYAAATWGYPPFWPLR